MGKGPLRIAWAGGALALAAVTAAPAAAVTTCPDLQTALDNASTGATISIDATLTSCSVLMKTGVQITLQGTTGNAGFDAGSGGQPNIRGVDVGATVIRDLTFRNTSSTAAADGGAIRISGDSAPTLLRDRFFNNHADAASSGGGAVALQVATAGSGTIVVADSTFGSTAAGQGNGATGVGGGLYVNGGSHPIRIENSVFAGNSAGTTGFTSGGGLYLTNPGLAATDSAIVTGSRFEGNTATAHGGGAQINSGHPVIRGNVVTANRLTATSQMLSGAGVDVFSAQGATFQQGNLFTGNEILNPSVSSTIGGGEHVVGQLTSLGDRFIGNRLPAKSGAGESEGGGVALEACDVVQTAHVENLVAAGNLVGAGGEGAGVYAGCASAPLHLELLDSTIAGNQAGAAGTAGLDAGVADLLLARNSIVAGNLGGADLAGFASRDIMFSDVCASPGVPAPGAGNICADPALAGATAGDVHETPASPTVDRGSTALVPPSLVADFEGQPRIAGAAVDMGADEVQPPATPGDVTPPRISGVSLTRTRFAVGPTSTPFVARRRRRVPRGTTIRFSLTEAAKVRIVIERRLPGRRVRRRVGGRLRTLCVRPTRSLRRARRCTRYPRAGTLTRRYSSSGRKSVAFSGRVGRRALARGSYRLTLTATDAAGNRSSAQRRSFRIVHG